MLEDASGSRELGGFSPESVPFSGRVLSLTPLVYAGGASAAALLSSWFLVVRLADIGSLYREKKLRVMVESGSFYKRPFLESCGCRRKKKCTALHPFRVLVDQCPAQIAGEDFLFDCLLTAVDLFPERASYEQQAVPPRHTPDRSKLC